MYLRWQTRNRKRSDFGPCWESDLSWYAILVEAVRIEGKPRQKHVAYLGSFTESQIALSNQRIFVWESMIERLDTLANRISPKDRKTIEAALAKKIGRRPTKSQRETAHRRALMP
jgi:hypothetical protein